MEATPRGPNASPIAAGTGRRKLSGERGGRPAQRGERRGARHAVGRQAGPGLEAAQRGVRARAEAAVDRTGREAVGASRNCSAATSQPRARRASGRLPSRGRPRRPSARRVCGPATPSTARPRRACTRRIAARVAGTGDAVDAAGVEVHRAQRDLQRRDVRGGLREGGRGGEQSADRDGQDPGDELSGHAAA